MHATNRRSLILGSAAGCSTTSNSASPAATCDEPTRTPCSGRSLTGNQEHSVPRTGSTIPTSHSLTIEERTPDAWTSVVPWGLTLSALVVLILLFTGWMGWSMVYRHRVGVVAHG